MTKNIYNILAFASDKCLFANVAYVCGFYRKAQQFGSPVKEGGDERKEAKKERKSKGGLLSQRNKDSCN